MKRVIALGHGVGFFSMFTQVLTVLDEFPGHDIITYFNSNSLYWEPNGWNGSRNVWEYYFESISPTNVESLLCGNYLKHKLNHWNAQRSMWEYRGSEVYDASLPELENMNVEAFRNMTNNESVFATSQHANWKTGWGGGGFLESNRALFKNVIDKHIKLKPVVLAEADKYERQYMAGRNVVGIHYRGTDKHTELQSINGYDGKGPRPIETYLKVLDGIDNRSLVYLATDSQLAYDKAKQHLGSRLLSQNGWFRSSGDTALHTYSSINSFNKAQHGEQVVIDWILLSRCSYFVHGLSNLSASVLFMAPELQHLDVYSVRI